MSSIKVRRAKSAAISSAQSDATLRFSSSLFNQPDQHQPATSQLASMEQQLDRSASSPQSEADLQRRNTYLSALHQTSLSIMNHLDVHDLLEAIVARATYLMHTVHGYVYLVNADRSMLEVKVGLGVFSESVGRQLAPGNGVGGTVWQSGQMLVVDDYQTWTNRSSYYDAAKLYTVIGVPLKSGRRVIGVLGLAYLDRIHTFDNDELSLLEQFAHLASIAFDNATLYSNAQHELGERQRAEQALVESEQRYRDITELTSDYIYELDVTSNNKVTVRGISGDFAESIGYSIEELNATGWASFCHPDDLQALRVAFEQVALSQKPTRIEFRVVTKGGATRWMLCYVRLARQQRGDAISMIGAFQDITARKQAYEQLRESEQSYRSLFDYTSDGVMLIDMEGKLIAANRQMLQMLGYDNEDIAGRPFIEFIPPNEVAAAQELFAAVVAGQPVPRLFERSILAANGETVLCEMSTGIVYDAHGEPLYSQTIARNITERKQAEQQLRLLSAAVHNANDGVMITNATGNDTPIILYVNDALCRMSGYSAAEMIGQPQSMMIGPATDRRETAEVREARLQGVSYRGEFLFSRKDRSTFWLEVGIEPIKDAAGNITNWVIISRDVTVRKQQEQQLLHLSTHDYLTELPNRRWLEDCLARLLAQSQLDDEHILLFIDLDHFKAVNDTLGHEAGDAALRFVAQLLSRELPAGATLARIGGDEFAVLLEQTPAAKARAIGERLQLAVASQPFVNTNHIFPLSLSIGMVVLSGQQSVRALLFEADTMMYIAKKQGGNRLIAHQRQ